MISKQIEDQNQKSDSLLESKNRYIKILEQKIVNFNIEKPSHLLGEPIEEVLD